MKLSTLLLAVLASASLLASSTAFAEKVKSNQQFLSKQPYHEAPATEKYNADDKWEGATLVTEEEPKHEVTKQPHLRLHSLGKRPFIEKSDVQ